MWWNRGIDSEALRNFRFDDPRCAIPTLASDGVFDEGTQHLLGEDFAVSDDVHVVHQGFFMLPVQESDKVSGECISDRRSARTFDLCEPSLVSDSAVESGVILQENGDQLAGVKVGFEFGEDLFNQAVNA